MVDPPKWHDVGPVLLEYQAAFPPDFAAALPRLAEISRWLRRERDFAFYGDVDLIPTESYGPADGERAQADALAVYDNVAKLLADRSADS